MSGQGFHAAITDNGLCHAYNGNNLRETYSDSSRVEELASALDGRTNVESMKIEGTEGAHKKVFWLNLADR